VLVVDGDNVVRQKYVKLGQVVDQLRVIKDGLEANDLVIVNGLMRARPGAKVTPEVGPNPPEGLPQTSASAKSE
jgi:multidrug efflux pump subunit AcrA (membrane-fusion protein)